MLTLLNICFFVQKLPPIIFYNEVSLVEEVKLISSTDFSCLQRCSMPKSWSNSYDWTKMSVAMVLLSATLRWLV